MPARRQRNAPVGQGPLGPALLLVAGLVGAVLPAAQAARSGGTAAAVLLVDQWASTGAQGELLAAGVQARRRAVVSTAAGLASDGLPALDQSLSAGTLQITPVPWKDPPLRQGPGTVGWQPPGPHFGAPADSPAIRIAALSALAVQTLQAQAPDLAGRLAAALQSAGVNEGWFNFRQILPVAGQRRSVFWTLHASAGGAWFAGTPAIDAPGSAALQVSYIPRAAAAGLPDSVRYAQGGWLSWTVADGRGHPLPGGGSRDTGGVFDGAQGLACLLGALPAACAAGQETIADLIERLGAVQVDLQVATALQPVYAVTPAGQRYALASLRIDRSLRGGDAQCLQAPWRFHNDFQAAFQLQARIDHWQRSADGQWRLQDSRSTRLSGAAQPWKSLELPLDPALRGAVAQLAIDPDRDRLVRLDSFADGLQPVSAGPVRCIGRN